MGIWGVSESTARSCEKFAALRFRHAGAVLEIELSQASDLDFCAARREALSVVLCIVAHEVFLQRLEAHSSEVCESDAEVSVCRAVQRLVESACFQQGPKPDEEVGSLDVGVAREEIFGGEPVRRGKGSSRVIGRLAP